MGQGETCTEALHDVESAIQFHVESFGEEVLEPDPESPVLDAFVAEAEIQVK